MPAKKATTTRNKDIVKIMHEGVEVSVDLTKMCPPELFKKLDVPGKRNSQYIAAPMVREVLRARGIQVMREYLAPPALGAKYAVLQGEVTIDVDGQTFCWTWLDVIWLKKLSVAAMGQWGHVTALALKSALKKRFRFFEGDFATAEMEGNTFSEETLDELSEKAESIISDVAEEVKEEPKKAPTKKEIVDEVVEEVKPEPKKEEKKPEPKKEEVKEEPKKEESNGIDDIALDEPKKEEKKPEPKKEVADATPAETEDGVAPYIIALKQKLEESKKAWDNTLTSMVMIGKAVVSEFNIERDSAEYKELIAQAEKLRSWFTA